VLRCSLHLAYQGGAREEGVMVPARREENRFDEYIDKRLVADLRK